MILQYHNQILEFKPVSTEDSCFFNTPINNIHISCEYSFANLIMWGTTYDIQWCQFEDVPLILIAKEDVLLFPLSRQMNSNNFQALVMSFIQAGGSGCFTQVPHNFLNANPELNDLYNICEDRNFADYIHLSERLSSLSGKKLNKKRNLISQFKKNNPNYNVQPLKSDFFEACTKLTEKNINPGNIEHHEELAAIKLGFANFANLHLDGIVIFVNNTIVAFSIFSRHLDDSFLIHYEKSDYSFKGVAQVINWETAKYLKSQCKYINREQDLGLLGLRKAKKSYSPDTILINYNTSPR